MGSSASYKSNIIARSGLSLLIVSYGVIPVVLCTVRLQDDLAAGSSLSHAIHLFEYTSLIYASTSDLPVHFTRLSESAMNWMELA